MQIQNVKCQTNRNKNKAHKPHLNQFVKYRLDILFFPTTTTKNGKNKIPKENKSSEIYVIFYYNVRYQVMSRGRPTSLQAYRQSILP